MDYLGLSRRKMEALVIIVVVIVLGGTIFLLVRNFLKFSPSSSLDENGADFYSETDREMMMEHRASPFRNYEGFDIGSFRRLM